VGDLPLKGHALYDMNVYTAEWIPGNSDSDYSVCEIPQGASVLLFVRMMLIGI
jgi:hypothetical protein